MPRKIKHVKHNNVKQSVRQVVNVNVGEVRRKRSKRSRRPRSSGGGESQMMAPIPMPNVIYQTGYGTFPLIQGPPVMNPFPYRPPVEIKRPMMEDVGVGTEGFVEIPTLTSKREFLTDVLTQSPVEVFPRAPMESRKSLNMPLFKVDELSAASSEPLGYDPMMEPGRISMPAEEVPQPREAPMRRRAPRGPSTGVTLSSLKPRYKALYGRNPPKGMSKMQVFIRVMEAEKNQKEV